MFDLSRLEPTKALKTQYHEQFLTEIRMFYLAAYKNDEKSQVPWFCFVQNKSMYLELVK